MVADRVSPSTHMLQAASTAPLRCQQRHADVAPIWCFNTSHTHALAAQPAQWCVGPDVGWHMQGAAAAMLQLEGQPCCWDSNEHAPQVQTLACILSWSCACRAQRQGVPRRVPSLTTLLDAFVGDMGGDRAIHRCTLLGFNPCHRCTTAGPRRDATVALCMHAKRPDLDVMVKPSTCKLFRKGSYGVMDCAASCLPASPAAAAAACMPVIWLCRGADRWCCPGAASWRPTTGSARPEFMQKC